MAKISPVSIKYKIYARFEAQGALEKPDVIGAIFGQTEGLLGSELEMRELQKEGKIGRVDVELESSNSKTTGKIEVPSALDKAETSIIAAAIETIDRIGPSDASIKVDRIEDVRGNKRDFIIERAKKLLEGIEGKAESREISDKVKTNLKVSKIQEYEGLPAGDLSGNEIIVVEGRADVVNLVKNGVDNVIGMNGTILPEAVKELSYDKEITLFVDGDRGGKLIAKNVSDNARIDYIVSAPDGKEVEELAGKEILSCLRKKIPVKDFFKQERDNGRYREKRYGREENSGRHERREEYRDRNRFERKPIERKNINKLSEDEREKLKEIMKKVEGKKSVLLLDEKFDVMRKTTQSNLTSALNRINGIEFIVMDGTVISPVIRAAKDAGVGHIVASNFACFEEGIDLVSL